MPEVEKNLNYVLTASNNGAAAFRSFGQGLEDVGGKAEKTAGKLKQAEGGLAEYAKRVKESLGEDRPFKGILQGGLTGFVGDKLAQSTAKMVELKNRSDLDTKALIVESLKSLPVVGGFAEAGANIRELATGEKAKLTRDQTDDKSDEEAQTARVAFTRGQQERAKAMAKVVRGYRQAADLAEMYNRPEARVLAELKNARDEQVEQRKESNKKENAATDVRLSAVATPINNHLRSLNDQIMSKRDEAEGYKGLGGMKGDYLRNRAAGEMDVLLQQEKTLRTDLKVASDKAQKEKTEGAKKTAEAVAEIDRKYIADTAEKRETLRRTQEDRQIASVRHVQDLQLSAVGALARRADDVTGLQIESVRNNAKRAIQDIDKTIARNPELSGGEVGQLRYEQSAIQGDALNKEAAIRRQYAEKSKDELVDIARQTEDAKLRIAELNADKVGNMGAVSAAKLKAAYARAVEDISTQIEREGLKPGDAKYAALTGQQAALRSEGAAAGGALVRDQARDDRRRRLGFADAASEVVGNAASFGGVSPQQQREFEKIQIALAQKRYAEGMAAQFIDNDKASPAEKAAATSLVGASARIAKLKAAAVGDDRMPARFAGADVYTSGGFKGLAYSMRENSIPPLSKEQLEAQKEANGILDSIKKSLDAIAGSSGDVRMFND